MGRVLTDMDRANRADMALERDLREMARTLMLLTTRDRIEGTKLANDCESLAREFTKRADHLVQVWN